MNKINFIYTINNLQLKDIYNNTIFDNLCSFLKTNGYLYLKIFYDDKIDFNINNLIKIVKKHKIKIIINFENINNIKKLIEHIDYFEIRENKYFELVKNKYDNELIKKCIIKIKLNTFKSLDNRKDFFNIIIEDIFNHDWYELKKFKLDNTGIEFKHNCVNNIYYSNFGINYFHIINEFTPYISSEWSLTNNKMDINYIAFNFNKIFKNVKKILITGVTGQDGSNLANYLLSLNENMIIFGTIRTINMLNHPNMSNFILNKKFIPIILNLCDEKFTNILFNNIKPDYFFNCAAQSTVNINDNNITNTFIVNTMAPLYQLECIRKYKKECKYFSCGSCEEFGITEYFPQNLKHPRNPINLYGISKLTTHKLVKFYRENFNLFACHSILYNHEGVKRNFNFVSRKITSEIVRIFQEIKKNSTITPLEIGNINSKRDWSDSDDFVCAYWKILNAEKADDYILSSGESHTIKEFIDIAFKTLNIEIRWYIDEINPLNNKAYYKNDLILKVNKKFYRENDEKRNFIGDNTIAKKTLNWSNKTSFKQLIKKMIDNDLNLHKSLIN